MADLRISAEADADLDDIWFYVATEGQNAQRADYLLDRFAVFFSRLARNPYLGRRRDDLRPGYRTFPVGDYVVIYRVAGDDEVLILRIIRGSRDIPALFGK